MKIANTLRRSFLNGISLSLVVFSFAVTARAFDNYKQFKRDHWDFEASTQYYRTESNFGSNGQSSSLGGGNYLQVVDMNLATRYFYNKTTSLFVSGNIGSSQSKDSIANRSNTSFNQVLFGAEYLAYSEGFDLVPEVSILIPTDKVKMTTGDTVLNSEGVIELRPRLTAQKDFGSFGGYAYAGFTYRDEGRSFLLPWGVGTFLKFSNSRLGAELFGYQSVADDKDTNSKSTRLTYLSGADAGSFKFGAFNPALMDTNFFYHAGLRGPWSFEVDGGLSITGSNSANGIHVGALIRYSFDLTSGYTEKPRYSTPTAMPRGHSEMYNSDSTLSTDKKINQFHEDIEDGVDQRLFRPKPTKRPQSSQETAIQKQLDDTEMQIELKTSGKKKKRKKVDP